MEVWPALDLADGRVVRLERGDFNRKTTYSDRDPLEYVQRRFDGMPPRLHLVDLSGAVSGRFGLFSLVRAFSRLGVRVQTGGGLRTIEDVERAVEAGAERVVLGSQLVKDPAFRQQALDRFRDHVVAGLDVAGGRLKLSGWKTMGPPAELFWVNLFNEGWTRAQITDINRDGTLSGINESFWNTWAQLPGQIGAGGGISTVPDLRRLGQLGILFAVVGKAWIEGHISLDEVM